jgi:predicted GIY-YIG superfamily endonuclease
MEYQDDDRHYVWSRQRKMDAATNDGSPPSTMPETLYILQLEDDKWYVGKSSDVAVRFAQHTSGKGSAWTREYPPIRIAETRPITSPHDETNITKDLMKKYGVDNVRGGAYTAVDLSEDQVNAIRHELRSSSDACYLCGKKGHFANKCPKKEEEDVVWCCSYCDREFKLESTAAAHEERCTAKSSSTRETTSEVVCYRCGHSGHYATECYARTHAKGYRLDKYRR